MTTPAAPRFARYVGIDYSGAKSPTESLSGLRVFMALHGEDPFEVPPPPSPRHYWARREVAEWLVARNTRTQLREDIQHRTGGLNLGDVLSGLFVAICFARVDNNLFEIGERFKPISRHALSQG